MIIYYIFFVTTRSHEKVEREGEKEERNYKLILLFMYIVEGYVYT